MIIPNGMNKLMSLDTHDYALYNINEEKFRIKVRNYANKFPVNKKNKN